MEQRNNLKIFNKNNNVELYFFGEIGCEVTAEDVISSLKEVDDNKDVMVYLFSGGGNVFDAVAIKDYMEHRGNVDITVTGICASAASYLLAGARKIYITDDSRIMIHNASGGMYGTAEEHRKHADILDGISLTIAQSYAKRSGKDVEDIQSMMNETTWMNAEQALELGFVDSKIPAYNIAANYELNITEQEKENWEKLMEKKETGLKQKLDNAFKAFREAVLCIEDSQAEVQAEEVVVVEEQKEEEVKVEAISKEDVQSMIDNSLNVMKEELSNTLSTQITNALSEYKDTEKEQFETMTNDVKAKMDNTNSLLEEVKASILSNNLPKPIKQETKTEKKITLV